MYSVSVDNASTPHFKRRCRTSKKKRLRLKKRASLELAIEVSCCENEDKHDVQEQIETERQVQLTENRHQEQQREEATPVIHRQYIQSQQQMNMQYDDREEILAYEIKRRENILRNQTFLMQAGVSAAKLAARTNIGDEAAKEAMRQKKNMMSARRAALKAERRPTRRSRRLQRQKVAENRQFAQTEMEILA